MKIWGRLSSINVRKVVWAAQEAGVPFTRVDAGAAFGIVQTPEYLRLNPNGLVPTLEDGDLVLWESNTIVRYLATRYPSSGLLPSELGRRFVAEQWMDWQQTTMGRAGRDAFIQLIRTPVEQRQMALVEQSQAAMLPLLDQLERHLAQSPFIAGASFCMADIPLACEMHRWFGLPLQHRDRPHLQTWYAGMRARAASRGVLDQALS